MREEEHFDRFDFPREGSSLEGIKERCVVAGKWEESPSELSGSLGIMEAWDGGRSGGKEEEGGGSEEEEEMSAGDLAAKTERGGVEGRSLIGGLVGGLIGGLIE